MRWSSSCYSRGASIWRLGTTGAGLRCHWPVENGHEAAVTLLLNSGAELEARDNCDRRVLSWAAVCKADGAIKLLLDSGAELEARVCNRGTALLWAAVNWREAVVMLLQISTNQSPSELES
jgi:ankyrin repeat protein